ncbi:MAG: hypothetical protein AB7O24_13360 [Kofleriaceae bacterium]
MSDKQLRTATPGSWRPGVSGNPRGRPPKGSALTDAIRAKVDPSELVTIALDLARNGEAESTRLQALAWLRDSGYTRPAERTEIALGQASSEVDDALAEQLTDAQLDALDRLDEQRAAILAGRVQHPLVVDGDARLLPSGVAQRDHDD